MIPNISDDDQQIPIKHQISQTKSNMFQPLIRLNPPPFKQQGVTLDYPASQILQASFVYAIIGKGGSGKSHLLSQLLTREDLYSRKFQRILYCSPSWIPKIKHDMNNTLLKLDCNWIQRKIKELPSKTRNVLVVLDDVISQMPKGLNSSLQKLFFNRRHILQNGCVSILITSQKVTCLPKWVRSACTGLMIFSLSPSQTKSLVNQFPIPKQPRVMERLINQLQRHQFVYINCDQNKVFKNLQFQL